MAFQRHCDIATCCLILYVPQAVARKGASLRNAESALKGCNKRGQSNFIPWIPCQSVAMSHTRGFSIGLNDLVSGNGLRYEA